MGAGVRAYTWAERARGSAACGPCVNTSTMPRFDCATTCWCCACARRSARLFPASSLSRARTCSECGYFGDEFVNADTLVTNLYWEGNVLVLRVRETLRAPFSRLLPFARPHLIFANFHLKLTDVYRNTGMST